MIKLSLYLSIFLISFQQICAQSKIIIECQNSENCDIDMQSALLDYIGIDPQWKTSEPTIVDNKALFSFNNTDQILISSPLFSFNPFFLEPGDSIYIKFAKNKLSYSGQGSEKFHLLNTIEELKNNIKKPENPKYHSIKDVGDYFEWNCYLNHLSSSIFQIFEAIKNKISPYAHAYLKSIVIADIEQKRLFKFSRLIGSYEKFGICRQDLCDIYDSSIVNVYSSWLCSLPIKVDKLYYFHSLNLTAISRLYEFDYNHEGFKSKTNRRLLYYKSAQNLFDGLIRENYLAYLLTSETIKEVGFTQETEFILNDYYSSSKYPEFRNWVVNYEIETRKRRLSQGRLAPEFTLVDADGNKISSNSFRGKIQLLYFSNPDYKTDESNLSSLNKIRNAFREDNSIVFLNVSLRQSPNVQKENSFSISGNWPTYFPENNDHISKSYQISSAPKLYLIDSYGRIAENPLSDITSGNIEDLIKQVHHLLILQNDGPYLFHERDSIIAHTIYGSKIITRRFPKQTKAAIQVQTDLPDQYFTFKLKSVLETEPSEFIRPEKIFVVSDIEGNFRSLRTLLQANGIIDSAFNWKFTNGHLVLNGDFFDRGQQVTECLWLLYSLEDKAKKQGGYVHFILGNHEIMNLSGDLKYLQPKYKASAHRLNLNYQILYDTISELGKWLRTKNIIERVGDLLFCHGGISSEFNQRMPSSLRQINEVARKYYSNETVAMNSSDTIINTIYNRIFSPFWFRQYFDKDADEKAPEYVVNATLNKFQASKIIVGHSIISDSISLHYDGKIINIDISDKTQGLLILKNNFYRATNSGEKVLIHTQTHHPNLETTRNKRTNRKQPMPKPAYQILQRK